MLSPASLFCCIIFFFFIHDCYSRNYLVYTSEYNRTVEISIIPVPENLSKIKTIDFTDITPKFYTHWLSYACNVSFLFVPTLKNLNGPFIYKSADYYKFRLIDFKQSKEITLNLQKYPAAYLSPPKILIKNKNIYLVYAYLVYFAIPDSDDPASGFQYRLMNVSTGEDVPIGKPARNNYITITGDNDLLLISSCTDKFPTTPLVSSPEILDTVELGVTIKSRNSAFPDIDVSKFGINRHAIVFDSYSKAVVCIPNEPYKKLIFYDFRNRTGVLIDDNVCDDFIKLTNDHRRIIYAKRLSIGEPFEIWISNFDGSKKTKLYDKFFPPGWNSGYLALSLDDKFLAVANGIDKKVGKCTICIINIQTKEIYWLTSKNSRILESSIDGIGFLQY